jgi:DNA replication and repair protein RecF
LLRAAPGTLMLVEHLTLRHFRNYQEATVSFAPGGAYIIGANGSGKTNLLEALYFLANQMSFRTTNRDELQGWGAQQCLVSAAVTERQTQRQNELAIRLGHNGRRLFLNGKETKDTHKFASCLAAVAFHPGTLGIIKGGPAGRRYFVDRGLASVQPAFLPIYQEFQRILKQRNALLRLPRNGTAATLEVWTERFVKAAVALTRWRQRHIMLLNQTLAELRQNLGTQVGTLSLHYCPAVLSRSTSAERDGLLTQTDNETLLQERFFAEAQRLCRAEDSMGQTLFGPQRDDIAICFRGKESRGYASQGEQRMAAFLLVAALAITIHTQRGHRPIVLLDDVISELDEHNRMVIFDFLRAHAFQTFITDMEERPFYRSLNDVTALHVRQVAGQAELWSATVPCAPDLIQ